MFNEKQSNKEIFDAVVQPIVSDCLRGFNGSIIAYGQTSSGKTHIMMGTDKLTGIIKLAVNEIFAEIERQANREFLIRVAFFEVYNEKVNDLLNPDGQDLKIQESSNGDIMVNCMESITNSPASLMEQIATGNENRCVGETNMNEKSSRSHTIFRIVSEKKINFRDKF